MSCPNIYDCDFESECTWQDEKDEKLVQLTWLINKGSTPSIGTGPSTDASGSLTGKFYDLMKLFEFRLMVFWFK